MDWVERLALGALLGVTGWTLADDEMRQQAENEITARLHEAARLWVLLYPEEADELRRERGSTSANTFLSLAENASIEAAHARGRR